MAWFSDSGKYAAAAMGVCSAATEALATPALQLRGLKLRGFGATQSFGEDRKLGETKDEEEERKRGREEERERGREEERKRRTCMSIHG